MYSVPKLGRCEPASKPIPEDPITNVPNPDDLMPVDRVPIEDPMFLDPGGIAGPGVVAPSGGAAVSGPVAMLK